MTIVHVIESGGGSAEFMYYLTKYIPDHKHIIIYGDRTFALHIPEVKELFGDNVEFHPWLHVQREVSMKKDIKALNYLRSLLLQLNFDVIHLHSSKAGFLGRLTCFLNGFKNVIYTPQGLPFARTDISASKVKFFIALEKFASKLNGHIISCSRSEAEALRNKGIPSSYIYNGTETTEKGGEAILQPPKQKFTIATSGRATIQKNPILFNTIAKLFEDDEKFEFVWVGTGELDFYLNAKNIRVTGWLPPEEVKRQVSLSDVYISTSSWEGLSFSVLEAMSLGKPLLLSNCIGNVDAVQEDYNGFTFADAEEAAEKIKRFFLNREFLQWMGENSRQLCLQQFEASGMAAQYEEAYHKVINQNLISR